MHRARRPPRHWGFRAGESVLLTQYHGHEYDWSETSSMKKSTDHAAGGTSFMIAGFGLMLGAILSALSGTRTLWLVFVYIPVGALIASIGAYWLWKAQGFYVEERTRDVGHVPGS